MRAFESPLSSDAFPMETVVFVSRVAIRNGGCVVKDLGTGRVAAAAESSQPDKIHNKPDSIVVIPDEPFDDGNQGPRSFPTGPFPVPHPEGGEPILIRYNFAKLPPDVPQSYSDFSNL